MTKANWNPIKEMMHIYPGQERPADCWCPCVWNQRPLAIDFFVMCPFQTDYLNQCAVDPMSCIDHYADVHKYQRYQRKCEMAGVDFVAFGMGATGGFNAGALKIIDQIARNLEAQSPSLNISWKSRIIQSLSCSVMRSNAKSVMRLTNNSNVTVLDDFNGQYFTD